MTDRRWCPSEFPNTEGRCPACGYKPGSLTPRLGMIRTHRTRVTPPTATHRAAPMSGPTTGSAGTLAEALPCGWCDAAPGKPCREWGEPVTIAHVGDDHSAGRLGLARAILASDWMRRHDAEVRAEALREAADALIPFPDNDYGAFPWGAQKWLRDRAALAEEGERDE